MNLKIFGKLLAAGALLACSAAQAGVLAVSHPREWLSGMAAGTQGASDAQGLADLYLLTCGIAIVQGDASQSETACGKLIALDPKDADALELRGYAYLLEQRFERAEADFQAALRLKPDDAGNRAGYGQALSGLGHYNAAITQFAMAVTLAPANAAFRNGLCWARGATGKNLARALADCDAALKLAPSSPVIRNSRGMVELRMGRFAPAIADYDAALAGSASQASARFGRGLARLALGQMLAGVGDIKQARDRDPEIDLLFVTMGILPRQCGIGRPACPNGFPPVAASSGFRAVSLKSDPVEDEIAGIEAGRLDVMVDQIALILGQPIAGAENGPPDIMAHVALTLLRFDGLRVLACRKHRLAKADCAPRQPARSAALPADPILAIDQAYTRIRPVWAAMCANRTNVCRME